MRQMPLPIFALIMCALPLLAEPLSPFRLRQLREECERFNPDAARRALADLEKQPSYDIAKHRAAVEALAAKRQEALDALNGKDEAKQREAEKLVEGYRAAMLANPILDFDKILCVHRKVGNARAALTGRHLGLLGLNAHNHMDMDRSGFDNEIAVISNIRGKPELTTLYHPDDTAIVRDLDIDFDASRILFTSHRHSNLLGVFEIPAGGATNRVEVSPSEHEDVQWWDGCYLPNCDQVVFLGTAAFQFLPCEDGNMPMSVMYRKDRKTGTVIQLTFEQDSDYTPAVMNDGRIVFTRWEYSDLPHYYSRILMTMNPDGTSQLATWGSGSYFPTFFYNARNVPGDPHKLVMFGGGHHDRAEIGRMFLVDPTLARAYPFRYDPPDRSWGPVAHILRIPNVVYPKEKTGLVHEFPGWGKPVEGDVSDPLTMNQWARGKPYFSFPYPLSENYHLATLKCKPDSLMGIYLVDVFDNMVLIAEVEDGILVEPMPYAPRQRPPVIPDRVRPGEKNCTVHIADIYNGPGLGGIPRGTVKKLRLFSYHYNYQWTGGHSKTGLDRVESGWDIKRVLGTVDIEEDGSACFEMPANTPISFQPLDEEGAAVQIMRSWVVGMPGERVSCMGCHEDTRSSVVTQRKIADKKPMQKLQPVDADGIRPWGFANEAWPVVQKYCLGCHGNDQAPIRKPDQGGAENKGLRLTMKNAEDAYRTLHPYIRRPGPESETSLTTPMDWHASTSPLVQMLKKGHHGVTVAPKDMTVLYTWIDLNAPFYGKWNPTRSPTQPARRKELATLYANVSDDPEAEHDAYAKLLAERGAPKAVPPAKTPPRKNELTVNGWPIRDINAAYNKQVGAIDQIAPVTSRVIVLGNGQSMTFRRMPAGTFIMGSDSGYPDEFPTTAVRIEKPFWISEMEVKNEQYYAFDPDHDSRYQDQFGKDHIVPGYIGNHRRQPVVRVSWNEAMAFCAWLSKTAKVKATLPTEAQWEWAARAGTDTPFPWGGLDDDFSKFANFADRDVRAMHVTWDGGGAVRQRRDFAISQNFPLHEERFTDDWFTLNYVGRTLPNTWGLYDMHGNAAEWTRTAYRPYPYAEDGRNDPNASGRKVARGGSFNSRPRDATSSFRVAYQPWQKVFDVGFRVVIEEE